MQEKWVIIVQEDVSCPSLCLVLWPNNGNWDAEGEQGHFNASEADALLCIRRVNGPIKTCFMDLAAVMNETLRRDSRKTSDMSNSGSRNCANKTSSATDLEAELGACLVVVRCADDEDGTLTRDVVGAARSNFTEEDIGRNAPNE